MVVELITVVCVVGTALVVVDGAIVVAVVVGGKVTVVVDTFRTVVEVIKGAEGSHTCESILNGVSGKYVTGGAVVTTLHFSSIMILG